MNNIFSDMLDVYVLIYLDDILIYLDNIKQHHKHVHKVLRHLQKNHLYTCANKCDFHTNSVEYLGYMFSPAGLFMADYKVKTIQEWPELCKVKDNQSFLGFANFYWRFIFNYSNITITLTYTTLAGCLVPECTRQPNCQFQPSCQ